MTPSEYQTQHIARLWAAVSAKRITLDAAIKELCAAWDVTPAGARLYFEPFYMSEISGDPLEDQGPPVWEWRESR